MIGPVIFPRDHPKSASARTQAPTSDARLLDGRWNEHTYIIPV